MGENEEHVSRMAVQAIGISFIVLTVLVLTIILFIFFVTPPTAGLKPGPDIVVPYQTLGTPIVVYPEGDRLPQGPSGFDVDDYGHMIIADAVQSKLVVLDNKGHIDKSIVLPFTPGRLFVDRLRRQYVVENSATGEASLISFDGKEITNSAQTYQNLKPFKNLEDIKTVEDHSTEVIIRNPYGDIIATRVLQLTNPPEDLLTVRSAGTSSSGIIYLDVEIAIHGDVNGARRVLFAYDLGTDRVVARIPIDAEYFYLPFDTLGRSDTMVYQMVPSNDRLVFKTWIIR